jgi:hypothetical protein
MRYHAPSARSAGAPKPHEARKVALAREAPMLGLMQDWSLLIHRIIDHAAIQHGSREIVSRGTEGMI